MHRVHKTSPEGCVCVISFGTIESSDKAIRKVFRHLEGERTHYSCRMRKCPLITTQLLYVSDTYILYLTLADVDGIVANSSQLVRSGLWVAGISVKQVRMYCCCFCCHVDIVLLSSLLVVGVVFFLLLLCLSSLQHCYHHNYCLFYYYSAIITIDIAPTTISTTSSANATTYTIIFFYFILLLKVAVAIHY